MKWRPIEIRTERGSTVTVSGMRITPESRAVIVRWPRGGWVWNHPLRVTVEDEAGARIVPVRDRTRRTQGGFVAAALMMGIGAAVIVRRRKRGV